MSAGTTRALSLRKNFSWTLIGNVVYAACQWGMLVLMAKLGSAQAVGQFSLALALTTPVFMLTNLQLRAIQSTDAHAEYAFGHYLGLRLWTSVLAMLFITGVVLVGDYPSDTAVIVLLMGASKFIESVSDAIFGLLQKNEQMDRISISFILKGVISLAALALLLLVTDSLTTAIAGFALAGLIVLLSYDLPSARRYQAHLQPVFTWRLLWPLVKLSLPLGIVMMLLSLNTNIPRYFIEHTQGTEALGYFAAITYIIVAGNTVINALGQSASPRLARYYAAGEIRAFRSLLLKLTGIGVAVGIAGIGVVLLAGEWILTLIYTADYAPYNDLFLLVMVGACVTFLSSFFGYAMTSMRLLKVQPYLFTGVTLVSLLASWALIPSQGLTGAAYAVIVTSCMQLFGAACIVFYELKRGDL